jgi:tol-pal system protein YbgF
MTAASARFVTTTAFALTLATILIGGPASAQYDRRYGSASSPGQQSEEARDEDSGGLFGGLFGRGERARQREQASPRQVQSPETDLVIRIDRLENQIRQLTGMVEQLEHRNRQLEQQLMGAKAPPPAAHRSESAAQPPVRAAGSTAATPHHSDVFHPEENPSAPDSPQTLGAIPSQASGPPPVVEADPPAGASSGAPLDLGTMAERASEDPQYDPGPSQPAAGPARTIAGPLPAPPPRYPSATGGRQQLASAPSASPRDEFALAQGYVQRRDYALAEQSLREFLKKHPTDRLIPDAHYWLGESLFRRQRYRDAAESFLTVSTKYERSDHAVDSLLRLGQSLAALGEREAACATLGEVVRKYPKASAGVKQSVEREQKRVRC